MYMDIRSITDKELQIIREKLKEKDTSQMTCAQIKEVVRQLVGLNLKTSNVERLLLKLGLPKFKDTKEKIHVITLRIDEELKKKIDNKAKQLNTSINKYLKHLVEEDIANQDSQLDIS